MVRIYSWPGRGRSGDDGHFRGVKCSSEWIRKERKCHRQGLVDHYLKAFEIHPNAQYNYINFTFSFKISTIFSDWLAHMEIPKKNLSASFSSCRNVAWELRLLRLGLRSPYSLVLKLSLAFEKAHLHELRSSLRIQVQQRNLLLLLPNEIIEGSSCFFPFKQAPNVNSTTERKLERIRKSWKAIMMKL